MEISNKPSDAQGPNRTNYQAPGQVGKPTAPERPAPQNRPAPADKLDISDRGREIAEIAAAANRLPDVREARVEEVKKAVDAGTYHIDARKIAESILKEL